MKYITGQMTAFDWEDEPGKEYLRVTFNIDKKDMKKVMKARFFVLGRDYIIATDDN